MTTKTIPAIPSLVDAQSMATAVYEVVNADRELKIEILNDQGLAIAGELLKDIMREYKEIDAERKKIAEPLHALHKWANGLYTPALNVLKEKELKLKEMVGAYTRKKQEAQRQLLAQAAKAAQAAASQAHTLEQARHIAAASSNVQVALQRAQAAAPAKVEGVSVGEVWRAVVEDETVVPDEFWTLDQRKLDAAVKSGVRSIPGVRIFAEAKVMVRT